MSRGGARPGAGRKRKHSLGELVVLCAFYPGTPSHLRALAEDELVFPGDFPAEVAAELEGLRLEYVGSREVRCGVAVPFGGAERVPAAGRSGGETSVSRADYLRAWKLANPERVAGYQAAAREKDAALAGRLERGVRTRSAACRSPRRGGTRRRARGSVVTARVAATAGRRRVSFLLAV